MQKIAVEKDGVRALVDADKLDAALAKSWVVVPEGEGEEPAPAEKPARKPSPTMADNAKAFATGASRWGSLGLDDTMSGLIAGGLEAISPTSLSDEGDDVLTRLQKGYSQGKADRRALVDEMSDRAPTAYNAGAVTGAAVPIALVRKVPEGLPRMLAGRAASTVGAVGISDADPLSAEGAEAAAKGWVFDAALGKMVPVAGAALSRVAEPIKRAVTTAAEKGRGRVADALDALVSAGGSPAEVVKKKATDLAKEASKRVRGAAPTEPVPPAEAPPAAPVDDSFAQAMADDALARRLGGLVDEPMPTMPPRNPRTPADQIPAARNARTPADQIPKAADPIDELVTARMPPASEPVSTVVPVVTKNSSAGNIAQAVEAKAVELGTTDLATIANALKLPTTLVSDPLRNAVQRFAFREAVKASAGKAAPVADDAAAVLKEIAAEGRPTPGVLPDEAMAAINQAKREVPRSLLPGDRPMAQVAGANQGAEMRAAYNALDEAQRVAWIANLRRQGLDDEKIRTMLGITKAKWRQTSFNR